ncbi:hypothetical protein ABVK25_003350 [Lepraria finkii]|uniref:Letm1 RBD domain-containing protein n=1 Tax=Lepraria finkii TaxID=1340010 RepID=A0ABR4BFW3_9LECA
MDKLQSRERALGYSNSQPSRIHAAVREGLLTRADFQLLLRSRRDVTKLPLFILLWIVCGEFTPLVVIFVTWIVPRTIWIPQQVEAARKEAEERRKMAIKTSPIQGRLALPTQVIDAMLPEPRDQLYKFIAQSYGLYPAWWDKYVPSLIPGWFIKRRVRQRVAEIGVDDFAITRDGGVWRMDEEEVVRACEERGIDVLGRKNSELREELEKQLEWRDSIKLEDAKKMGIKEVQM